MSIYTSIASKPLKRKAPRRVKDPAISDQDYLIWIHTLPCAACFSAMYRAVCDGRTVFGTVVDYSAWSHRQTSTTEAAHVGDHPAYRRAPDRTAIPLCAVEHHREGPESYHKLTALRAFWQRHGLDRDALIRSLNESYDREHGS